MKLHKHIYGKDVAILKLNQFTSTKREGYIGHDVMWFNISNPKNHFYMGLTEEIWIKLKDIKNWKEL